MEMLVILIAIAAGYAMAFITLALTAAIARRVWHRGKGRDLS